MVKFRCSQCLQKLSLPETAIGKKVKCPKCSTVMEVPSLSSSSSSSSVIPQEKSASEIDSFLDSFNKDAKNASKSNVQQIDEKLKTEATQLCPYCGEAIFASAKKCKHCGEFLFNSSNASQPTKYAYSQPQKQIEKSNDEATLKKFFNFDYMITPGILRMFFIISVIIISISAVMYVYNINHMAHDQNLGLRILIAIFGWLSSVLVVRLFFEILILFWKIHETLREIKDK